MLTPEDRAFIDAHRVARLATADAGGAPHIVPICFVVDAESLYLTIDKKPKSGDPLKLKRLRNITDNPQACVIIDRYDDDWSSLGWVMLQGRAEIISGGDEHAAAQAGLKARYSQYRDMTLTELPVIAVRIQRVVRWGNLAISA
jgi:PPOX class probable F420-dependent enzyme